MNPDTYQSARKRIGTQAEVAAMLELDPMTISRRERGELPITREAALAIDALKASQKRPARGKRAAMRASNTNVQRRSGGEPASPSVLKPTDQPPTPERSL